MALDGNNDDGDGNGDSGNDDVDNGGGIKDTITAATMTVIAAMTTAVAAAAGAVAAVAEAEAVAAAGAVANHQTARRKEEVEEENFYSYVNLVHNQSFFTSHRKTTSNDLDCHILTH